ncbi:MAG: RidA family protein [Rhodobacteraceae bacterium]|nr:RidA family protein [Paracoccaceae bacterium]
MSGNIDTRLNDLGITLPEAPAPAANYVPFVRTGNLVYISGQISIGADGLILGKLGENMSDASGVAAARRCGMGLLAQLKAACDGDLDRVKRVVKLGGFVNCTPDYTNHPAIINGCSDLMVEVFGAKIGSHARAAVGTVSLPLGVAVEVEGIFEIA